MATQAPKQINPEETFQRVVSWIKNRAEKDQMPGIIVGVSGTDSLVVFLAAYEAFKQLGRPEAVTAVNFVHPGTIEPSDDGKITCVGDNDKDWFAREIMPWLEKEAPGANYVLDDTIPFSDDNKRWGNIFSRAIDDTNLNHGMLGNYRLVAGTRNKTEAVLGTYTLISKNTSLQPIEHLYKTEILAICDYLRVPDLAIQKSREVDCDCGRFDVQANYLDQLDYYIMSQEGIIDPEFLKTLDPDILRDVRNFYIEERENNKFREEVPYRPTPTKTVYAGEDFSSAMQAAIGQSDNIQSISQVTPRIVIDRDVDKAYELLTANAPNRSEWMAEAFTLMGTDGLDLNQKRDAVRTIFGLDIERFESNRLTEISAKIGQYAFSFPAKRFTTQRFSDGLSLIERAGFARQTRPTDIRDESLPKHNPQRDEFGIGFTWMDDNWYVEQRRAYTLFSSLSDKDPVSLLIRNSSYFFGRDRLKNPAYVSWNKKTPDELLALTANDIESPDLFTPWQHAMNEGEGLSLLDRADRVSYALDAMGEVDLKFSQWLRTHKGNVRFRTTHESLKEMFNDEGGYTHLRAFLKDALLRHVDAEKSGSPLYLAQLDPEHVAPWQPHRICEVNTDTLAQLKGAQEGVVIQDDKLRTLFRQMKQRQLVLMSGEYGDFPVRLAL